MTILYLFSIMSKTKAITDMKLTDEGLDRAVGKLGHLGWEAVVHCTEHQSLISGHNELFLQLH